MDTWRECFAEHNLLTWASAISFQVLVALVPLTSYINLSAIVFLVGAQADELVRKDATPGEKGLFERMRAAFG